MVVISSERLDSDRLKELFVFLPVLIIFGDRFNTLTLSCWKNCLLIDRRPYVLAQHKEIFLLNIDHKTIGETQWPCLDVLVEIEVRHISESDMCIEDAYMNTWGVILSTYMLEGRLYIVLGDKDELNIVPGSVVYELPNGNLITCGGIDIDDPNEASHYVANVPLPCLKGRLMSVFHTEDMIFLFDGNEIIHSCIKTVKTWNDVFREYTRLSIGCDNVMAIGTGHKRSISAIGDDGYVRYETKLGQQVGCVVKGILDTSDTTPLAMISMTKSAKR